MKELLEQIIEKQHTKANEIFESHMSDIVKSKLNEVKKMIAARMDEQVTVDHTGKVHTASGEKLLPSVYRARRQLAEGKWSKKVQPGDEPKVVKAKKEMANTPLPPGKQAAKERAEKLRMRRMEKAKAREERKAAEAKKEKMAKKAKQIASGAGMSIKQASEVIKGEKPKKPGIIGRIMKKIGLREQALARAKAILEAKTYSGTGSKVLEPNKGDHVVYDGNRKRILGIFNNPNDAEKFAKETNGHYPGVHKG